MTRLRPWSPRGRRAPSTVSVILRSRSAISKPCCCQPGRPEVRRCYATEDPSPRSCGPARKSEVKLMLVRIGNATDVADGQMRVFDVAGTNVNVSNVNGRLYAFDDTCTHMGCSLADGEMDG